MLNIRHYAVAVLVLGLTACAGSDTTEPPAPLEDFQAEARFEKLWETDTGAGIDEYLLKLQLFAAVDTLYIADHEGRLSAIDRENGKLKWKIKTGSSISAGVGGGSGLIMLGTRDGQLIALRQKDGSEVWRADLGSEILAPPAVDMGIAVVRTVDGNLQAFSTGGGEKLWSYKYTVPSLSLRGTSQPVIFSGAVFAGTDNGRLSVLSLTNGRLLWDAPIAIPTGRSELSRMVDIDIPVIIDSGLLYIAAYQGRVVAMNIENGQTVWASNKSVYNEMSLDERNIYVADENGHLSALNRYAGSTVWVQDKLHARPVSGTAVVDGAVVVGDFEGYLHALDSSDGRFIARSRFDSSGIVVAPLVIDNTIYALNRDGDLAALRLQRK